jgi:recombination protein RecA
MSKKPFAERQKEMKAAIAAINKKEGETVIGNINNEEIAEKLKIYFIETPSMKLNNAIGGGVPRGKFTLVSGEKDSGKTMLLLETMAKGIKEDAEFVGVWFESEDSLENTSIEMFGITEKEQKERFVFMKTGSIPAESVLDYVIRMAQAGVDMIVINSLKCLTPEKELKDDMADANIAIQARLNAKFMRKIIPVIADSGTALCIVQHLATDIGVMYGDNKAITGGMAIQYNNMLTMQLRKASINSTHPLYNVKDQYLAIKAKIIKNHCIPTRNPYVTVEYAVEIGRGIDVTQEILDVVFDAGIVDKAGAWIREYNEDGPQEKGNERILPDGTKAAWNGMAKFVEYVNNNPDYFEYLRAKVEGNFVAESLSSEEIEQLKERESLEQQQLQELESMIDEVE